MNNNYFDSQSKAVSLNKLDFFIISNLIIDASVKKYTKTYKTYTVPFNFVLFYFGECGLYKDMINSSLNNYFICYNASTVPFKQIMEIYSKSKTPNAKLIMLKKDSIFSGLKAGNYIEVNSKFNKSNLEYNSDNNIELQNSISSVKTILEKINLLDEKTLKTKYGSFVRVAKNVNTNQISAMPSAGPVISGEGKSKKAPRAPISITKKVVKLKIPKLELPEIYPKSSTLSRVDSRYFVYRFTTPSNILKLIDSHHIKHVKLRTGFLKKREALLVTKPKSRFSDFF